jgi:hypothetical protein
VFQIHGVDERGKAVLRKQLKRTDMMKFFEFGIVIPQGIGHIAKRLPEILDDAENSLLGAFRQLTTRLRDRLKELDEQVGELEVQIQR